ncbi:MAG: hypothetical protein CMH54_10325 [Myxococcales bacterium]|nr:hypothetical protein [Myxococcales bacterium]|tara:strand:+ start:304 stop:984 length:681 start_codon:yes stop_codon:yes gene_type:complete
MNSSIRVQRHGHACFSVLDTKGRRWLFDPYRPDGLGGRFNLPLPPITPYAIVSTHAHEDHAWRSDGWDQIPFIEGNYSDEGVCIQAIALPHDAEDGTRMGYTRAFRMEIEGDGAPTVVVHTGDIGTIEDPDLIGLCQNADLLIVPAGGNYTIGPEQAVALASQCSARIVVLMHFREPGIDLPMLTPDEAFAKLSQPVERIPSGELTITENSEETRVVWMAPATAHA